MVKVQKPTPKTFGKTSKFENSIKKKPDGKSVGKMAPAAIKVQKAFAAPVKKEQPAKKEPKLSAQKRPLVLAPPQSPPPTTAPKKATINKESQPMAIAAPAGGSVANKRNKKKNLAQEVELTEAIATIAAVAIAPQETPATMGKKKFAKNAQKKRQMKTETSGEKKKPKDPVKKIFKPLPFDEDKFIEIVNVDNIAKIAVALKTVVETEVAAKKTSIFSDYQYFLNVVSFKIPSCPKRMVRLKLKHSLVEKEDDVVIVVPDLQRGAKVDFEPTIQHYEDLFREAGVEMALKVVPFNQLRNECNSFEAMRKFGSTYDYFLCDGRLAGHLAGFCGKAFQKPRTTFHAVRMNNPKNLKDEIEKSMRQTAFKQLQKGDLTSIPVGNYTHTAQQLAENVQHVVAQLKALFPGGWENMRSIHLKVNIKCTPSLPLYVSLGQAPAETPYVVGPREKRMLQLKKEANEVLSKFVLTKDAGIIKLSKNQVQRKQLMKETRAALEAEGGETAKQPADEDGEETAAPAKKARKEDKPEKDLKKNKAEEEDSDDDAADDSADDADDAGGAGNGHDDDDDDEEDEDPEDDDEDEDPEDDDDDDDDDEDEDEAGKNDDDDDEDDDDEESD